jgi:hypothetical protein
MGVPDALLVAPPLAAALVESTLLLDPTVAPVWLPELLEQAAISKLSAAIPVDAVTVVFLM